MRDTSRLRTRIALLASLPSLAAAVPACSPPPRTPKKNVERKGKAGAEKDGAQEANRSTQLAAPQQRKQLKIDERKLRDYEAKAKAEGKTLDQVIPAHERDAMRIRQADANAKPAAVPAPSKSDPIPGDPPYIDGYNPEEAHCVSGNWCGANEAAVAIGVPKIPPTMDCPTKITGGQSSKLIKADPQTYEGLSTEPNMQGALNEHGTELVRARTGNADMCCYHWFNYCSGRPHLDEDGPVVAEVRAGDAWNDTSLAASLTVPSEPEALRQRIAREWLEDAQAEHASVAAFARATLELMAVGAPPSLLAEAQRAGLDEIRHAQQCFALAGHYGGHAVEPGALPALAPRPSTLARLAADTFAEGCVGETIAALVARRAARGCAQHDIARTLEAIADDETGHAALAWQTITWALQQGGPDVAEQLRSIAVALAPSPEPLPAREPDARALSEHGRLDARAHAVAARDAWAEIINPMLDRLLATPAPALADMPSDRPA
ncbi:MAG: ferritin-like domain-containing protein [Myxococcota bacterium]